MEGNLMKKVKFWTQATLKDDEDVNELECEDGHTCWKAQHEDSTLNIETGKHQEQFGSTFRIRKGKEHALTFKDTAGLRGQFYSGVYRDPS